jgi:predicted transcriptional regulator of viral defense system
MMDSIATAGRKLASEFAVLRTRDFERNGIPRQYLTDLVNAGIWEKLGRGLYASISLPPGPHHSLLEVARKSPHAVVCLLSALRFHELTTERPSEVWIALPRNTRAPRMETVRIKAIRLSEGAFTEGVEEHRIEGGRLRVYSVAKTVADCFKFRNQIGTNVGLEALRDAWRSKKATADELWHHAKVCRVANIMRPYLEAVVQ